MSSLRKLRRRLLRWNRYADAIGPVSVDNKLPPGYWRAYLAVERERERRQIRTVHWPTTDYDPRCCLAGDDGHDGPCVVRCDGCDGNSRCPECGGVDDLGCWYCEGTGGCPRYCDDGEIVIEEYVPRVVTEHAFADRGLL